jgi:hypothetical protein
VSLADPEAAVWEAYGRGAKDMLKLIEAGLVAASVDPTKILTLTHGLLAPEPDPRS